MTKARPAGRWIPWAFVAFFLVVFAANGTMIAVALGTWTGLKTHHAYEEGLAYNEHLAAREAQNELGWQVAIALAPIEGGDLELKASLVGPSGAPLFADEVRAEVLRPTLEGHDLTVILEDRGKGRYGRRITLPLPGQWDVRLHVTKGTDLHVSRRRFVIEP